MAKPPNNIPTEEDKKRLEEILKLHEKIAAEIQIESSGIKDSHTATKLINDLIDQRLGKQAEFLTGAERAYQTEVERLDTLKEQLVEHLHQTAALTDKEKRGKELDAKEEAQLERAKKVTDWYRKQTKEVSATATALKPASDRSEAIARAAKNALSRWTGLNDQTESFSDMLIDAYKNSKNIGTAVGDVWKKMKGAAAQTNLFKTSIQKLNEFGMKQAVTTKELVFRNDALAAAFVRNTGASAEYKQQIRSLMEANEKFNISNERTAQSFEAMFGGLNIFSEISKSAQNNLTRLAAHMELAGVKNATFAKTANILNKTFGQTPKQFMKTTERLRKFSKVLGVDTNKAMEQFNQAASTLAQYNGPQAEKMFKKLLVISKATGIEMQQLISVASQFDTFQGAASAVGDLNAIMGGPYFNTLDMINATEEERIEILKRGFDATGKAWESLSKYERQALASAAGIKDVNEAAKLFSNQIGDIEGVTSAMEKKAEAEKTAKEQAEASLSMQENQALATEKLADTTGALAKVYEWILKMQVALASMQFVQWIAQGAAMWSQFGQFAGKAAGWMAALGPKMMAMAGISTTSFAAMGGAAKIFNMTMMGLGIIAVIAAIIAIIYLLATNWDTVMAGLVKAAKFVWGIIKSVFKGIAIIILTAIKMMLTPLDILMLAIQKVVEGISAIIPDFMEPSWLKNAGATIERFRPSTLINKLMASVQAMEEGTTNFTGGTALVGEGGPELVNLPRGTNVITNENTKSLITSTKEINQLNAENTKEINKSVEKLVKDRAGGPAGTQNIQITPTPISVQINDREIKTIVYDFMQENFNMRTV